MEDVTLGQYLLESLTLFIIFLSVAVAISWVAYLKKYFDLPFKDFSGPNISLKDVMVSFLVFLAIYMILGREIMKLLFRFPTLASNPFILGSLLQFIVFFLTVICLFVYDLFQDRTEILKIFKDYDFPGNKPIQNDISLGFITWFIATPLVIALSQLSEMLTSLFFGKPEAQQVAVESLKSATESPIAFVTVLISILMFAPFLEEYLFRGVLQSWLRRKIGSISAIFIAGAAFAFLHYAPQQGWTNIPLIISLFTFGCYLGFIYEKSRSLFAPIVLHVTFNLISVMRIILIEGK